jgi:hypothetical protein
VLQVNPEISFGTTVPRAHFQNPTTNATTMNGPNNIQLPGLRLAALGLTLAFACATASAASLVSRYSFSETSGTTTADSISGFNGTLQGAAAFNGTGSVVLNGTGGTYVSLPPSQLSGLTAITLDAWFTFTVPNNNVCLFSIDAGGGYGAGGTYFRYNIYDSGNGHGGTNYLENIVSWGGDLIHGGSVLPQTVTNHVTIVYDTVSTLKAIYVNGTQSSSNSGAISALSSYVGAFTLGRGPWAPWDPDMTGTISEFRVYNGALSDAEIADIHTTGPDTISQVTVGLPQISPTNTVYAGEPVVVSCGVTGPATGYYWQSDNGSGGTVFSTISGATSLSYTQNTTGLLGSYQYQFIATNASSSVTSSVVALTVNAAQVPVVTTDTTPSSYSTYTTLGASFSAAFDGNHPITNQWQMSMNDGVDWFNLAGKTNTTLTLTNLALSDAGQYRLAATNAIGGNASTPATLTVSDIALAKYQWQPPVPFNGLNADQILTNVNGALVGAAAFGGTAYQVTLSSGRILNFSTDGSIATATGGGTAAGAYPAATGLTTSNANFDSVLNRFSWDGGPKTITLNNLIIGEQYSVQIFAVDNRSVGGSESNRQANCQDPTDPGDISATFKMGDNVYTLGTFQAANTSETIQMNLLTGNAGSLNALVLRALSFTPSNQPPTITLNPAHQTVFAGHAAQFTVGADSYVVPTYQWQAGPVGGPFTNLSNGGVISGVTSNVLAISSPTAYAGSEFRAVVSNPVGSATSQAALLTVVSVPPTSGAIGTSVLALGPIAYWPLNETNDASSGGAGVYDAAGSYDGTYLTAAQNAFNGIVGVQPADGYPNFAANQGALRSTGNTDQSWATTPALNLNTNTATIGMWIYPDGVQPDSVGLFVNRNAGTVAGLGYYSTDRLGYKWNDDASPTWSFNSGLLIPPNVWSYVAVVIEPAQATLYLYNTNGLQTATNFTTHNNMSWGGSQSNIRIGRDNSIARTFNGRIDEVVVFSRALSQSEVLTLAGQATTPPTLSIGRTGANVVLTWSAGTLLEATVITGPWTTNSASSPYTNTPTGAQKFFRAVVP